MAWTPPEPDGPPLPLIGAAAAGSVAAALLIGMQVRKRRQARARAAARERMRRAAFMVGTQLVMSGLKMVRRREKAAPPLPPARRGRFFRR
jgi:hypothetical protein